jgi:hypothetical protein
LKPHQSLGKLLNPLRILMFGTTFLTLLMGAPSAQDQAEGMTDPPLIHQVIQANESLELPKALEDDPRLMDSWELWRREITHRDSLQKELDEIHGRAQVLGLRIQNLERDPNTNEPKDGDEQKRLLLQGEKIREEEDRISMELALSRQRIRFAVQELTEQVDFVLSDMGEPFPQQVVAFRERLLAWEGEIPNLAAVEVVIRPDDTPDVLRDKAGYLRDLADGLDGLAEMMQRRMANLRREQRLLEGAEEILEDALFLDEGGARQDQGEASIKPRLENPGGSPIARPGNYILVTPEQTWELSDLLEAEPSTGREHESLRTLLQVAVKEVAFQSDSIRAEAGRFEEEALRREAP